MRASQTVKTVSLSLYILIVLFPASVKASVIVSEVAWMGTSVSANDEWIELYNPDSVSVNLSGYSLSWAETSSSPKRVDLSGVIAAKSYYLLERTDDTTVQDKPANVIYVGALSNTGEKIVLRSGSTVLQTIDASSGWPAGDNTTKETMQWNGSSWQTAQGTPLSGSVVIEDDKPVAGEDEVEESATDLYQNGVETPTFNFTVISARQKSGLVGSALEFSASVSPASVVATEYFWSFGDGSTGSGPIVSHVYLVPGTYAAIARVRVGRSEGVSKTIVTINSFDVGISGAEAGETGYVEISNKTRQDVNLGGYLLTAKDRYYIFPQDFVVGAGLSVRLLSQISGFALPADGQMELRDKSGKIIQTFEINRKVIPLSSSTLQIVTPSSQITTSRPVLEPASSRSDPMPSEPISMRQASPALVIERRVGMLATFLSLPRRVIGSIIDIITD